MKHSNNGISEEDYNITKIIFWSFGFLVVFLTGLALISTI